MVIPVWISIHQPKVTPFLPSSLSIDPFLVISLCQSGFPLVEPSSQSVSVRVTIGKLDSRRSDRENSESVPRPSILRTTNNFNPRWVMPVIQRPATIHSIRVQVQWRSLHRTILTNQWPRRSSVGTEWGNGKTNFLSRSLKITRIRVRRRLPRRQRWKRNRNRRNPKVIGNGRRCSPYPRTWNITSNVSLSGISMRPSLYSIHY